MIHALTGPHCEKGGVVLYSHTKSIGTFEIPDSFAIASVSSVFKIESVHMIDARIFAKLSASSLLAIRTDSVKADRANERLRHGETEGGEDLHPNESE